MKYRGRNQIYHNYLLWTIANTGQPGSRVQQPRTISRVVGEKRRKAIRLVNFFPKQTDYVCCIKPETEIFTCRYPCLCSHRQNRRSQGLTLCLCCSYEREHSQFPKTCFQNLTVRCRPAKQTLVDDLNWHADKTDLHESWCRFCLVCSLLTF